MKVTNFTEIINGITSIEQIQRIRDFYLKPFVAEDVPKYFQNWTLEYNDKTYKHGIILTNKHSEENWSTSISINDNSIYTLDEINWVRKPDNLSEFISDVLREEDYDLIFAPEAISIMFDSSDEVEQSLNDEITYYMIRQLIDNLKTNQKALQKFKDLIITCQLYEFASIVRDFETKHFKATPEQQKMLNRIFELRKLLHMTGLDAKEHSIHLVLEMEQLLLEKGQDINLKDLETLKLNSANLWNYKP